MGLSVCRDQVITFAAAFAVVHHAPAVARAPRAGRPQARGGLSTESAESPIARLPLACSAGGRAAGTTADLNLHPRLHCLVAAAALRSQSLARSDENLVGRRMHKQGKLASNQPLISEL